MHEIKRYKRFSTSIGENDDGEWCIYADVAPIIAERDKLAQENERLQKALRKISYEINVPEYILLLTEQALKEEK